MKDVFSIASLALGLTAIAACSSAPSAKIDREPYYQLEYLANGRTYRYETHEAQGTGKGFGDSYKADWYGLLYANEELMAVSALPSIFPPLELARCVRFPAKPNMDVEACLRDFTERQRKIGLAMSWRATRVGNDPGRVPRSIPLHLGVPISSFSPPLTGRAYVTDMKDGNGTNYLTGDSPFPSIAFGVQNGIVNWITEDAAKVTTCTGGLFSPWTCRFGLD